MISSSTRSEPVRAAVCAISLLLAGGAFYSDADAAQRQQERRPAGAAPQAVAGDPRLETRVVGRMDAEATRQALMEVLQKHPPSVGRVLKLDPSLMRNESYLSAYPELSDFLAQHDEIPQNSAYYLERIQLDRDHSGPEPSPQLRALQDILAGAAGFSAFLIVLFAVIWLIRTILDQGRWSRLSKIQAEVHTKLMDRFSSNEELLNYVQTPPGRRFLESGPSPLQEMAPQTMSAPFSRILWSVQAGTILVITGLGMLFLSGRALVETRDFFYILGSVTVALGAGFLVSGGAAFVLSRRLGLLDRPVQNNA